MGFRSLKLRLRRRWAKRGHFYRACSFAFIGALLHIWLFTGSFGDRFEPALLDQWFWQRGAVDPPREVLIAAQDERSFKALGLSLIDHWPREVHAKLLHRLKELGARLVVFDIVFSDPGPNPDGNRVLAEALGSMPTAIGGFRGSHFATSLDNKVESRADVVLPLPIFRKQAKHVFLTNLTVDYGKVRRFHTGLYTVDDRTPLADVLFGKSAKHRKLPQPQDFVNYYGPSRSLHIVSIADILDKTEPIPPEHIRDKIVFVGALLLMPTPAISRDVFVTPFSETMTHGVEIHATVAANLLRGDWIRRLPAEWETMLLSLLAFVFSMCIVYPRPLVGGVILLAIALSWGILSYAAFLNLFFLPGLVLMSIVLPLVFIVSSCYHYARVRRSYRDIEAAVGVKLSMGG